MRFSSGRVTKIIPNISSENRKREKCFSPIAGLTQDGVGTRDVGLVHEVVEEDVHDEGRRQEGQPAP